MKIDQVKQSKSFILNHSSLKYYIIKKIIYSTKIKLINKNYLFNPILINKKKKIINSTKIMFSFNTINKNYLFNHNYLFN